VRRRARTVLAREGWTWGQAKKTVDGERGAGEEGREDGRAARKRVASASATKMRGSRSQRTDGG